MSLILTNRSALPQRLQYLRVEDIANQPQSWRWTGRQRGFKKRTQGGLTAEKAVGAAAEVPATLPADLLSKMSNFQIIMIMECTERTDLRELTCVSQSVSRSRLGSERFSALLRKETTSEVWGAPMCATTNAGVRCWPDEMIFSGFDRHCRLNFRLNYTEPTGKRGDITTYGMV